MLPLCFAKASPARTKHVSGEALSTLREGMPVLTLLFKGRNMSRPKHRKQQSLRPLHTTDFFFFFRKLQTNSQIRGKDQSGADPII